jgi:hypothetical protein
MAGNGMLGPLFGDIDLPLGAATPAGYAGDEQKFIWFSQGVHLRGVR